jgi:hypothetical protein
MRSWFSSTCCSKKKAKVSKNYCKKAKNPKFVAKKEKILKKAVTSRKGSCISSSDRSKNCYSNIFHKFIFICTTYDVTFSVYFWSKFYFFPFGVYFSFI